MGTVMAAYVNVVESDCQNACDRVELCHRMSKSIPDCASSFSV